MSESIVSRDVLLFAALPYAAIVLFVVGTLERLVRHPASLTSRSSQFLENRQHFWAMVPFHYGLLAVLAGHVLAFAMPGVILDWNASPVRLAALEVTGLAFGLLTAIGLAAAIVRRASVAAVRLTTTALDWIVLVGLLLQIVNGVEIAVRYSWGSSWFASAATPYLWSIVRLQPDVTVIASLPVTVKAHVIGAFLLVALFPFSRLVHVISVPARYLWRRTQVVRWYRPRPVSLEKQP